MKQNKKYSIVFMLSLFVFSSCIITSENKNSKSEEQTDKKSIFKSENNKEGWVEYELRLELPNDDDANLLEDILFGAIEGLIEHLDPRFSVKFKNEYARIDFDKVNFLNNEFQFDDSINNTFRLFDFDKMIVTDFETDEDEKWLARSKKIDQEKYKIEKTGNRKDVLGFDCEMAYLIDPFDNDTIIVWYAPSIHVPLSPFEYVPIEGLSLEMIFEGVVMRAVQVSFDDMEDELFRIPDNVKIRKSNNINEVTREI
ncbi:MAG: hypothetical protein U9R19_01780 [Bacteroidota bacterium]|nr:hypothetical protein [Bacteroidota bacterium]